MLDKELVIKLIKSSLERVEKYEEERRLDIIRIILQNKNYTSDHIVFEQVEKQKSMNYNQVKLLKELKEEIKDINNLYPNEILKVLKKLNLVCENLNYETINVDNTTLIAALRKTNDTNYFIIKAYIEFLLGPNNDLDTSSKYSLMDDLLTENKEQEEKFYENVKKIKGRR